MRARAHARRPPGYTGTKVTLCCFHNRLTALFGAVENNGLTGWITAQAAGNEDELAGGVCVAHGNVAGAGVGQHGSRAHGHGRKLEDLRGVEDHRALRVRVTTRDKDVAVRQGSNGATDASLAHDRSGLRRQRRGVDNDSRRHWAALSVESTDDEDLTALQDDR